MADARLMRAHLVADHEDGQKIAPGPAALLGERPRERDDLDAGVAIGVKIPLVHVDPELLAQIGGVSSP